MALTNTKTVKTTGVTYDSGTFLSQNWIEQSPAGINTFAIEDNTLSSAIKVLGSDDVIYIEGNFADYQFKQNGKTITLNNGTQKSSITMNSMTNKVQVTTTLIFLDGSVTLSNKKGSTKVSMTGLDDNGAIKSQLLTTKLADVKINATDNDTAADYFADLPINDTTIYTLTVNPDTFVGTASNDLFDASTTGTLSSFDNLTGGTGTDTLNVYYSTALDTTALALTITGMDTVTLQGIAGITTDVTTWGTTALTVTNTTAGAITANAAATTAVAASNSFATGAVTITGGLSQTVTANGGNITLSGSVGAINATETAQGANDIIIDGGTTVNVTSSGVIAGGTIIVGGTTAPTGAVVVNTTTSSVATTVQGLITVTGGTTVTVSQNKANAVNTTTTAGAVTVNGSTSTTSVSVSDVAAATASATVAGRINNTVTVTDVNYGTTTAGTITAIAASGYTALFIGDSALTTLSVANGSGNIIIDNSDAVAAPVTTLAVTVNGLTGGTLDDADVYTTLNVTTATANSTLANITTGAVTTLNVTGPKLLTVNSVAGLSAVTTITSGAGGLTLGSAIGTGVTYTGGTGNDTLTVGATTKAVNVGTGNNSVTVSVSALGAGGTITSGSGTNDTLTMSAANAATASGTSAFATAVTGFENLTLTGATNQTIDLAVLGNYTKVSTSGGNGLTLNNFANNSTLTLTGAGTAYTLGNAAFTSGVTDVVNLVLTDGSTAGIAFAATGITAANVETIAITTADTQAVPSGAFLDTVTLLGNSATSITVAGNAGLNLTAADTALTSLNASGITLGGFTFTSGILANSATITGSATGTNTVAFTLAATPTKTVTYIGGTGNDVITGSNGLANTVTLGNGTNSYTHTNAGIQTVTGGSGADTITTGTANDIIFGAGGADQITGGAGADSITISDITSLIVQSVGASGTNTSTTIQTDELTSTFDVVYGATAGDHINLGNANIITGTLTTAGTNLAAGVADTAVFARGAYDSAAGKFTYAANGADTAITYDADIAGSVQAETIILVGYVSGASTALAGLVTLV